MRTCEVETEQGKKKKTNKQNSAVAFVILDCLSYRASWREHLTHSRPCRWSSCCATISCRDGAVKNMGVREREAAVSSPERLFLPIIQCLGNWESLSPEANGWPARTCSSTSEQF